MTTTNAISTRIADAAQRGYALVALLALMTVLMVSMMAAAPSIRQQSRRQLEQEAIARGEEVAEAIRRFIHYANRLPNSMEELQEGAPVGTKKVQVLRRGAARDPLSESGEWRLIRQNDRAFISFIQALTKYAEGRPVATSDPKLKPLADRFPRVTGILDTGTPEESPGGEDTSIDSKGPFIGVASRSRRESVTAYYGIERHDGWVFTPFFK